MAFLVLVDGLEHRLQQRGVQAQVRAGQRLLQLGAGLAQVGGEVQAAAVQGQQPEGQALVVLLQAQVLPQQVVDQVQDRVPLEAHFLPGPTQPFGGELVHDPVQCGQLLRRGLHVLHGPQHRLGDRFVLHRWLLLGS